MAKLKKSPFAKLRESFDFYGPERRVRLADADSDASSVKVLEVTKVGRFTAFVLSASDAAGLSSWLSQNGFVRTPATDVWLAHYVKLRFFYVAMRYEPAPGAKGKTTAETVRISFDSPLPYYPYLEPDPPDSKAPARPRLLEIWLASTRDFVPVAPRSREKADWVRPFLNGARYTSSGVRSTLASAVEAALLPAGRLRLQRFADQKRSRVGFGDVVFVPGSDRRRRPPARGAPRVRRDPRSRPRATADGGRQSHDGQDARVEAARGRDRGRPALRPGSEGSDRARSADRATCSAAGAPQALTVLTDSGAAQPKSLGRPSA